MAKAQSLRGKLIIKSAQELITTHAQTRSGFIEAALAKNEKATPYIALANSLKLVASQAKCAVELLRFPAIRPSLLTASGLSDKAVKYFTENDKDTAIKELIDKFLKPAGVNFVDELVYRFLLIKGDSLGGAMRNYVGAIAQMKLVKQLLASLDMLSRPYEVLFKKDKPRNAWKIGNYQNDFRNAEEIVAIAWTGKGPRVLFFNTDIPLVGKNVDICLYDCTSSDYDKGQIVNFPKKAIMYGELKGGIDPAGADEHWKTGNTALERIREAYSATKKIPTSFIAAAIEQSMANEIWEQLQNGTLSYAANITVVAQLTAYCHWVISL